MTSIEKFTNEIEQIILELNNKIAYLNNLLNENNIKSIYTDVNKDFIRIKYMSFNFYDEETYLKIFKTHTLLEKLKNVYNNVVEEELDDECYTGTYLIYK